MEALTNHIVIGYKTRLFADGLESVINGFDNFRVTSTYPIGNYEITDGPDNFSCEILLMELNCPINRDLAYIQKLKESNPHYKIVIISHMPRYDIVIDLLDSGIAGYFLKSCGSADLLTGMSKITEGKSYFCSEITKSLISAEKRNIRKNEIKLTEREKEILGMLVTSHSNKQIASVLNLSENTVKTHRKNIHAKFGVSNLIGLVRYACRSNLIEFGDDGFCLVCPYVN